MPPTSSAWPARLTTFVLAALAAASLGFWVLAWPTAPRTPVPDTAYVKPPSLNATQVADLLGARASDTQTAQRGTAGSSTAGLKLVGIIATANPNRQGATGSALIAVEGAPARPYRVGQTVTANLTLQSVQAHSVALSAQTGSSTPLTLELPPPPGMKPLNPSQ